MLQAEFGCCGDAWSDADFESKFPMKELKAFGLRREHYVTVDGAAWG